MIIFISINFSSIASTGLTFKLGSKCSICSFYLWTLVKRKTIYGITFFK